MVATGENQEAWVVANKGKELNDGLPLGEGFFGYLAGALGHKADARRILEESSIHRDKGYAPALPIAWTYLGMGETEACLEYLEKALAEREPYLGSLMVFPGYDAIRDRPEFERLAQQVGLLTCDHD